MKTLVNVLVATLALTSVAASANDLAGEATRTAKIVEFNVDPQLAAGNVVGGSVMLNPADNTIELMLNRGFFCPPGRFCAEMMPAPMIVKLPIVKTAEGVCGAQVYVAEKDLRPVDGDFEQLTLTDYSTVRCMFLLKHATQLTYDTISAGRTGQVIKTHSTFGANLLEEIVAQ